VVKVRCSAARSLPPFKPKDLSTRPAAGERKLERFRMRKKPTFRGLTELDAVSAENCFSLILFHRGSLLRVALGSAGHRPPT